MLTPDRVALARTYLLFHPTYRNARKLLRFCFFVASLGLLGNIDLNAQQTGVSGRVTDTSGGVMAGVHVVAASEGGAKISTMTTDQGAYQFPSLRRATYTLRFEMPGFAPAEKTISVLVGQSLSVDLELHPASTSSTVDVSSAGDSVETTSSQVGGNVNPAQVSSLPLNGRNWMELSMLVPGVTKNAVDFTPLGTTSAGKFQINVDGQQVTQNSAGDGFGQPQYSRDAMDQFQIITNRFDATLGRSAQMQINAQTKAGTNELHGTAYGYFRSDVFNAADPIAQRVLPFSDKQFGATVGGAIKRDKLWFFGAYEGERQPSTFFLQPQGFIGQSFSFPSNLTTNSYLARVDWQVDEQNRVSIRGTGYTWENPFTGLTGVSHPSRAASRARTSYSLFGTWSWVHGGGIVNEVKAGWNHFDWDNQALVPSQEYRFNSNNVVGGPYNFPQIFVQNTQQFRDDLYWLKGSHSVKTGAEYLYNLHTGYFQQNLRGTVLSFSREPANFASVFPVWNDPASWNLASLGPTAQSYVQGFGNFNINVPRNTLGFWVQDDWKLNTRLTLNLGLRYDNDIGVFQPGTSLRSGIVTPRSGDNLLFAPRIGFAWDIKGDRKMVIRGGTGLYYADIQANQVINQTIFNGEQSLQPAVTSQRGPINLLAPFGSATGDDFLSGRVPVSAQSVQILGRNAHTPYSFQTSIGFERQIGSNWNVSADFVHWRVYRDWIRADTNVAYNPATGYNLNPNITGRPDPRFVNILTFLTPGAAGSIYDGLQVSIQRRLAAGATLGVAYTLARLKDSTSGAFYYPNNPYDLSAEWANSSDDQRHTLSVNSSYKWKWGLQGSLFYHYGSGQAFQTTAGGNPFGGQVTNRTLLATTRTYNNPRYNRPTTAAGYLVTDRNQLYGRDIHRVDARFSKTISIKDRYRIVGIAEAFNLLNHANYGSYQNVITQSSYGAPAQNSNLAYAARMLQLAARFEF